MRRICIHGCPVGCKNGAFDQCTPWHILFFKGLQIEARSRGFWAAALKAWKFSAVGSECFPSEMSSHELPSILRNLQGTKEPSLRGPSEGPLARHLGLQVSSRLPRLGRLVAHTLGGKKCKLKRSLFEEVSWLKLWYR